MHANTNINKQSCTERSQGRRFNWKYNNDIKPPKKFRESIQRAVEVTHLFAVIDRKEVLKCRQEAGKM